MNISDEHGRSVVTRILVNVSMALLSAALIVFLQPRWAGLSFLLHLLYTLGIGTLAYSIALAFGRTLWERYLHTPLIIIANCLIPIGLEIARMGKVEWTGLKALSIIFTTRNITFDFSVIACMLALCLIAWYIHRHVIAMIGAIFWGSALYGKIAIHIARFLSVPFILSYTGYALAFGHIALGYFLVPYHLLFAFILRLSGALSLGIQPLIFGDWVTFITGTHAWFMFWRIAWPVIGTALIGGGLKSHDNALLIGGTASLITFICTVSWTYGRAALGVPLLLLILGAGFLALSYAIITVKRFSEKSPRS